MRTKGISFILAGLFLVFFSGVALAQHGHSHGQAEMPSSKKAGSPGGTSGKGSAQSMTVEGMKISLEVMSMGEHMKHTARGGSHSDADHAKSHSLMVTIQDLASKEIISDARVAYTLSAPSGQKETGKLTWSGDHYSGAANLKEKGTYQVQLAVESGGMEKQTNFKYHAK